MHDTLDRPRTLLPTNQVSDFSRNFAQLSKHTKRPYSLAHVIRALSAKPNRLDGFELEVDQELKSLNKERNTSGILVSAVESKPASDGRIKTSHFLRLNRSEMFWQGMI
jgi:hypothetical protein